MTTITEDALQKLTDLITNQFERINSRLTVLEQGQVQINERLTRFEERLTELEKGQARIEERLNSIEGRMTENRVLLEKRIDNINKRLDNFNTHFNISTISFLGIMGVLVTGILAAIWNLILSSRV